METIYNNSYFDADEFLAEEQLLPCTFKVEAENLGPMLGYSQKDISKNTLIQIPFWFGNALYLEGYLEKELPVAYRSHMRHGIEASPDHVDIGSLNHQFYLYGKELAKSAQDPSLQYDLETFLAKVYSERITMIFDHAHLKNGSDQQAQNFLSNLDEKEKEVFKACQLKQKHFQIWSSK